MVHSGRAYKVHMGEILQSVHISSYIDIFNKTFKLTKRFDIYSFEK